MDDLFPKVRNPEFVYQVKRHGNRVTKHRVKSSGPRHLYVWRENALHARRDSWKSLFHEYYCHYLQAKHAQRINHETKIAKLQAEISQLERELRQINLTNEEDL